MAWPEDQHPNLKLASPARSFISFHLFHCLQKGRIALAQPWGSPAFLKTDHWQHSTKRIPTGSPNSTAPCLPGRISNVRIASNTEKDPRSSQRDNLRLGNPTQSHSSCECIKWFRNILSKRNIKTETLVHASCQFIEWNSISGVQYALRFGKVFH